MRPRSIDCRRSFYCRVIGSLVSIFLGYLSLFRIGASANRCRPLWRISQLREVCIDSFLSGGCPFVRKAFSSAAPCITKVCVSFGTREEEQSVRAGVYRSPIPGTASSIHAGVQSFRRILSTTASPRGKCRPTFFLAPDEMRLTGFFESGASFQSLKVDLSVDRNMNLKLMSTIEIGVDFPTSRFCFKII